MRLQATAAAAFLLLAGAYPARALDLHRERSSPYDLALSGLLTGVPAGETWYVGWSDLRALPTSQLTVDGEFVKGSQLVTVVFLDDLLKALPAGPGADTLLATCASDGYASVFSSDFISRYRPFLVLEINGKGPRDWPPPGLLYNPSPYVITVSKDLVPASASYRDIGHKKPWAVTAIQVASYADAFKGILTGKWSSLSPAATAGREIWVNSCASCHPGPSGTFGGTKSGMPFPVIAAIAGSDRAFFMKYVRNPKSIIATAKMEPHPHYTDGELSDLISFITAGQN
jgi:hypothetical protein